MMTISTRSIDIEQDKVLYVVSTSHLDTQWRWTFQDTIHRYIPATLRENFELFEKFPTYKFSFEGAIRYMMAKEYYPEDYETLKKYIAEDRWCLSGSVIDTGDTNTVSPESLIRQILYGNGFFRKEFGKVSRDLLLPDCFGFSWVLPSVAHHCGLKGFSTSKLEWGSSYGIPFNLGMWQGVDGNEIVGTINPGQYSVGIEEENPEANEKWLKRIEENGAICGAFVDFRYFGLGDTGGAPDEESVRKLEHGVEKGKPILLYSAAADALHCDLTEEHKSRLPRHENEFLLIEHGTGTYTSHGELKRWNRRNEGLADAAEKACLSAEILGGATYPKDKLRDAWVRFLANQMHDILPGTSIPPAYHFTWNDELLSLNQFETSLKHGIGVVAQELHTMVDSGVPVVVYNQLSFAREDIVEVEIEWNGKLPQYLIAVSPDRKEVPAQVISKQGNKLTLIFLASVPSLAYQTYEIKASDKAPDGTLSITESSLENERYLVLLDEKGDIASVYDKALGKELLSSPMRLEFLPQAPKEWPAWTIMHKDVMADAKGYVGGAVQVRVLEQGPVRVVLEVKRQAFESVFIQRISLATGKAGDRLEIDNTIGWKTHERMLKATFPLTAKNPKATYDIGWGVIERGNNHERLHEVPGQQWADISDPTENFGVSIINDCKYGWDKPDDQTLRLTLLHTPEMCGFNVDLGGANFVDYFQEQNSLDFGWHRMVYGLHGHHGTWDEGDTVQIAIRLNQPLIATQVDQHKGTIGKGWSLASLSTDSVMIKAMKQAEESDEMIIRVQELSGKSATDVVLSTVAPIKLAREVNGMEESIDVNLMPLDGKLQFSLPSFGVRTFALQLSPYKVALLPQSTHVEIPYNIDVISQNDNRQDGDIDGKGHSLPAELLPEIVVSEDIIFKIGPSDYHQPNAVACMGQEISLPGGDYDSVYLLAASVNGDASDIIRLDEEEIQINFQDYTGFIGQWYDRVQDGVWTDDFEELTSAWLKKGHVAWVGTHRHSKATNADEAYVYCYLYSHRITLKGPVKKLCLPKNSKIRVMAVSLVKNDRGSDLELGLEKWFWNDGCIEMT
jgi:alpha-mannosidase